MVTSADGRVELPVSDSAAGSLVAFALAVGAVGSVVAAASVVSVLSEVLVCAPPVLTTTPGGACDVVAPVEVDTVVVGPSGSVSVTPDASSSAGSVKSGAGGLVEDSADDGSDVDESGVSAHATPHPYPVTTAAPTPRATAKPPIRPTYAAAFMPFAYARDSGGGVGLLKVTSATVRRGVAGAPAGWERLPPRPACRRRR